MSVQGIAKLVSEYIFRQYKKALNSNPHCPAPIVRKPKLDSDPNQLLWPGDRPDDRVAEGLDDRSNAQPTFEHRNNPSPATMLRQPTAEN